MNSDLLLRLAIQRIGFLKTEEKIKVSKGCRDISDLPGKEELVSLIGRRFKGDYAKEGIVEKANEDLSLMLKQGISILSIEDDVYPTRLKEIHNPPFLLYCRGEKLLSQVLNISVVGTRKATGLALEKAYALSFHLARSGAAVTSGLASGIDSAAHNGALDGKGYTVAVFGCGIDRIYPSSNRKLASRILEEGGTLISEYPPGTPPVRYNFPERNRIVSALSEAVVVVESPARSGALITADFALEQGRDVFVLKTSSPSKSASAGTDSLISDGALEVGSSEDILRNLSYSGRKIEKPFIIGANIGSRRTGRFLADRMMAELNGREISREGVYYSL